MDKFLAIILAILAVGAVINAQNTDRRLDALEDSLVVEAVPVPTIQTILVGQGCEGAAGPNKIMIGLEEDEFTHCDAIDAHEIMVMQ